MFIKTGGNNDKILSIDRSAMACYAILIVLWGGVVTKTFFGSKLPFVYALSSIFVASFILLIVNAVFLNWIAFGENQKGLDAGQVEKISGFRSMCFIGALAL